MNAPSEPANPMQALALRRSTLLAERAERRAHAAELRRLTRSRGVSPALWSQLDFEEQAIAALDRELAQLDATIGAARCASA